MMDLFVFCGQSNMMGASARQPVQNLRIRRSLEFRYRDEYLGRGPASFVPLTRHCGEFLYLDPAKAYPTGEHLSTLTRYGDHACFVPAMSNAQGCGTAVVPFRIFSEAEYRPGCCMIPFFAARYEELGGQALCAHIARGGVGIRHYFSAAMARTYNRALALHRAVCHTDEPDMHLGEMEEVANRIFTEKCRSFFRNAEPFGVRQNRTAVWLQGESDAGDSEFAYRLKLELLWEYMKSIGFGRFFCVRVGYWGKPGIIRVMRAQEDCCRAHGDCFMVSRAASYMPDADLETPAGWYLTQPGPCYRGCRDTAYGYNNSHINEKGMRLIGWEAAENAFRILHQGLPPRHGPELLRGIAERD